VRDDEITNAQEGSCRAAANRNTMLLRHRPPPLQVTPSPRNHEFEHVPEETVALLRRLQRARVEFVLVGAVARAVRGDRVSTGPLTIVPAPYGRNADRLDQLRIGAAELEVIKRPADAPAYQELMYEATRFDLTEDVAVEVAAPEDIELYDHLRRTGAMPQMKVSRADPVREF
jgi:hypothetical protein